jgi:hypothetical protein
MSGPKQSVLRSQTALTAGVVVGRFELGQRMRFIIGGAIRRP